MLDALFVSKTPRLSVLVFVACVFSSMLFLHVQYEFSDFVGSQQQCHS